MNAFASFAFFAVSFCSELNVLVFAVDSYAVFTAGRASPPQ